jgi:hypothetical protein
VKPEAEEARLRYLYRQLILRGKLRLPRHAAVKLVGPDCAYHLYRDYPGEDQLRNAGRDS